MGILKNREIICIEGRIGFIKQVVRWVALHVISLLGPILLYYYAFENYLLGLQFLAVIYLLCLQGIMLVFLDRILNIDGRIHDIWPLAPRFCQKHFGAIMLVPILSLIFIGFLCIKKRSQNRAPLFIERPGLFAEGALLVFTFTVISPVASLIWPEVSYHGANKWIATPGAFTITQTVERFWDIGMVAKNPELLEVSDLRHTKGHVYVSALTFELVRKRILNDLPKIRTRKLASDDFEREIGYVGNLCELMKWADNTETMFTYFHPAYALPMSGWDTGISFLAEQYFLHKFKYEVHKEIVFYFHQLDGGLHSEVQKTRVMLLKDEYAALNSSRALYQVKDSWLSTIL
jgi:hypothetical protein